MITGRPAHSAAMQILFLLSGPKMGFFALQGRHVAPINVKFGMGQRTAGPLPCAKFHVYQGRNVGIQPQKLSKFQILAINLPLRGDSFASFLRNSQRLYASYLSLSLSSRPSSSEGWRRQLTIPVSSSSIALCPLTFSLAECTCTMFNLLCR